MNENNKTEELSAMSLGNVENMNTEVPVSEEPVEILDSLEPVNSVNTSIPEPNNDVTPTISVENTPNSREEAVASTPVVPPEVNSSMPNISEPQNVAPLEPVAPVNYDIPEVIDNSVYNDIGTVPPLNNVPPVATPEKENTPKKKGINKTLFVVIIILALGVVGTTVYIILNKVNAVVPKLVNIEVGSKVSSNINDYATFNKNVDSSTCNFDTTAITDTNKLGARYTFKITCGKKTYTGTARIVDTKAPEVKLKEVNIDVNGEVKAEDFIDKCTDKTKCSYSFKEENKIKDYVKEASSYHVPIIITDEAGNKTEATGVLNVSENIVSSLYLVCTKENDKYTEVSKYGLDDKNEFNKSINRTYKFVFNTEEYQKFKELNNDKKEVTYQDITGTPEYDDDNKALTITKKVSYDDLKKEVNKDIPTSYGDLKSLFESMEYSCSLGY